MSLLTWKSGPYSTHYGSAVGVRLFAITWKSRREDPNWLMRSDLPGFTGNEWKDDDLAKLQCQADSILAGWLAKVTGLPTADDEAAACEQAFVPWWENDADMGSQAEGLVGEGFAAGWLARARRGKGETS